MNIGQVVLREQGGDMQIDLGALIEGSLQVRRFTLPQGRDSPLQQFHIEAKTELLDMAALFFAEDLAGATDLEVMRCQGKSHPQLFESFDRFEPFDGVRTHRPARGHEQISVSAVMRATYPAAELIKLSQPEFVGAVDDNGIGRGHIDAALDDGGADQDVKAAVVKIEHDSLQFP